MATKTTGRKIVVQGKEFYWKLTGARELVVTRGERSEKEKWIASDILLAHRLKLDGPPEKITPGIVADYIRIVILQDERIAIMPIEQLDGTTISFKKPTPVHYDFERGYFSARLPALPLETHHKNQREALKLLEHRLARFYVKIMQMPDSFLSKKALVYKKYMQENMMSPVKVWDEDGNVELTKR